MSNVSISKIGLAVMRNRVLSRFLSDRLSHTTIKEKKQGYLEIKLKGNKKLRIIFGPDKRNNMNTELEQKDNPSDTDKKQFLQNIFKQWCKETKRSGGILIGASVREFLNHLAVKLEENE